MCIIATPTTTRASCECALANIVVVDLPFVSSCIDFRRCFFLHSDKVIADAGVHQLNDLGTVHS